MSEIRRYFKSRFKNGKLMEFDFSQLEVVALAYLSQDPQLIADIKAGIDLHTASAAAWLGIPESAVTSEQRKKAKMMTFQLQYGAGYKSMAKKLELSEKQTKQFIEAYYNKYKGVKAWQEKNIAQVRALRIPSAGRTPKGLPQGIAKFIMCTGRRLTFKERDTQNRVYGAVGHGTDFYDTEIKNYPVQSFATGDIVPHILGKVYRAIKNNSDFHGKVLLINTVHDSIVFDVSHEFIEQVYELVLDIMNNTNYYMKQDFGLDINVPITADCSVGPNWMEMTKYG